MTHFQQLSLYTYNTRKLTRKFDCRRCAYIELCPSPVPTVQLSGITGGNGRHSISSGTTVSLLRRRKGGDACRNRDASYGHKHARRSEGCVVSTLAGRVCCIDTGRTDVLY